MINTVYQLVSPKIFEETFSEIKSLENKVIVRPSYLSICKSDQRYYCGKRDSGILDNKLPMARIHEGIGEVILDNTGTFNVGDNVVMIPNIPTEYDNSISENYLSSSKFKSSNADGFMMEYVVLNPDRLVKLPDGIDLKVASFTELVSVSIHAIKRFSKFAHNNKNTIGVWGDGNLGYITSLLLKIIFPESKIILFGVNLHKLHRFSFVDETSLVNEVPEDLKIDSAFECVGTNNSSLAINQIIDLINPEGTIAILGVSELPIPINTRMILEKGLNMFGSSRSAREDFISAIQLFEEYSNIIPYLKTLITQTFKINNIKDINESFEKDLNSQFGKTVLIWDK